MNKDEWPELDIKVETIEFSYPTESITQEYSFKVSDWMISQHGSFEWEGEKIEASCRWVNSRTKESFPYRGGLRISNVIHFFMKLVGKE